MTRWIARLCRWAQARRGLRGTPDRAARRHGPAADRTVGRTPAPAVGRTPAADLLDVRLPSLELALDRKGLFGDRPETR